MLSSNNLCIATLLLSSAARFSSAAVTQSEHCSTMKADFARRQLQEWSSSTPYTIADGGDGDDKAKHVPVLNISDDGTQFTIVVGNGDEENGVWHPMVASDDPDTVHFISHIYVEDQDGNVVFMHTVNPVDGEPATVTGDIPSGVTELTPYEFCNLHGLWVGETVSTGGTEETDRTIECALPDTLQWDDGAWPSVVADFERQQKNTFGSDAPFTESDSEKHTPYITVNGDGTASILVGSVDGEIHPMDGSADGTGDVHWITEIYVVDDQDNMFTLNAMDPTGVDQATIDFGIPGGAKTLTAYIWCNIHGLYVGPTVDVATGERVGVQTDGATDQGSSGAVALSSTFAAAAAFPVLFL